MKELLLALLDSSSRRKSERYWHVPLIQVDILYKHPKTEPGCCQYPNTLICFDRFFQPESIVDFTRNRLQNRVKSMRCREIRNNYLPLIIDLSVRCLFIPEHNMTQVTISMEFLWITCETRFLIYCKTICTQLQSWSNLDWRLIMVD